MKKFAVKSADFDLFFTVNAILINLSHVWMVVNYIFSERSGYSDSESASVEGVTCKCNPPDFFHTLVTKM